MDSQKSACGCTLDGEEFFIETNGASTGHWEWQTEQSRGEKERQTKEKRKQKSGNI